MALFIAISQEKTYEENCWTHKIPTEKNFRLRKAQWHDGTKPTRLTVVQDPRNLVYSKNRKIKSKSENFKIKLWKAAKRGKKKNR